MRFSLATFTLLGLFPFAFARSPEHRPTKPKFPPGPPPKISCTLSASGGDDAPNFLKAVNACPTVTIPKSTTLNIETRLNMTGLRNKHISLEGTIKFSPDIPYWSGNGFFIPFQTQITFWLLGGENILFDGGGTLDGSGQVNFSDDPSNIGVYSSTLNSRFGGTLCRYSFLALSLPLLKRTKRLISASNSSLLRPITLTVFQAKNVLIENINMINSPEWHNLVNEGQNISYNNININAVSNSSHNAANTDGWNVYRSDNVAILNSVIVNGDDCVAFKPNATNVLVENLDCTGSQSLGQFPGMFDIVENVLAKNIKMTKAQNGARIKAWAGPNVGSGIVKNITFENFLETAVDNPIIIDQCYMTNATACAQFPSNTFIQDIWFTNITGTGTKSTVASLSCSPDGRCSDINLNDISLSFPSGTTSFFCQNVNITGDASDLFPICKTT
ncbi:Exopolygalacturonase [Psilocybe cubensis]|uniref:galacturonan 1,4-alpha-galacturonidase n=2 Tax=Psilocybe cubensis TaxID=181762 RepID=A0A8H7Y8U9_PSICU|nr:Exopolygalacturonase [Psilocybe cubensis]KAH9485603.1 Exopolygalacturonase [Psilocybe cubensis]